LNLEAVIAANRFGLGARPGELNRIADRPRAWLLDQLAGPPGPAGELAGLPASADVLLEVSEARLERRDSRRSDTPDPDAIRQYAETVRSHYVEQVGARYRHAASSDAPFHERLVRFWSNHFAVSADKQPIPAVAVLFENEAIRPNLGGKFADLLIAVESHPAMLLYLDNVRSIGPGSALGKRANRRRDDREVGLNENLAREILELHTLGVDGGYGQADVRSLARVITGWSVGGGAGRFADGAPGHFHFREAIHEPGPQTVLGQRYDQAGIRQGQAVLRDLSVHPATARHVATKLARHFIDDAPPDDAVRALTEVFLRTGGDLPSVHEALVACDAAWTRTFAKLKTPEEYLVSAFRAFGRKPENGRFVIGALETMGQAPLRPGSPAGWPDTAESWGGADSLYKRIEWASAAARFAGRGVDPLSIAGAALGPALGHRTRDTIAGAESRTQGVTLMLVSPEFQRR